MCEEIDENKFIQIIEFPDYYINKKGEIIKMYPTGNLRYLKYSIQNGYPRVKLYREVILYKKTKIKSKNFFIHRLVAKTFITNNKPTKKKFVNHKDGNKENYHCDNLEWVTPSENNIHYQEKLKPKACLTN
jgi:hypothetical protein